MSFWQTLRGNKYFVAATTALTTYLLTAGYNWANAGTPVLTLAQMKTTTLAALGAVVIAEYHLYTQAS
jgi:hypothetical protein